MKTPWGQSEGHHEKAEGIDFYWTPSHGGFLLSEERFQELPQRIRDYKTYAGGRWYEEDCDWAIIAMQWPNLFENEAVTAARDLFRRYIAPKL